MEKFITLYHGSEKVIETPAFGLGKENNDFGLGFYCTESEELAKEWACTENTDGYANKYELDIKDLSVLNLSSDEYTILHWLALLMEYRKFRISTPIMKLGSEWLRENFLSDLSDFDAVKVYRADDSYFDYAESFINNGISVEQLAKAMRLGKLGEQIVIKSKFAFSRLQFEGFDLAEKEKYHVLRKARDDEANRLYYEMLEEEDDGLYIQDIMRGGIKNDDPRIPRNISK